MADGTLHRQSLYPTDGSPGGGSNSTDPSFAIIPDWSTRLKVTSRGGDTKDCLLLNIKPRVTVTLQFRQPASMKFDMVGGVLSGPGCEAVESAFECLRQEWLSSNPEGPAQAWKSVIESSESARTIPAVVERIVAIEPQWKSFLTRFSDTSNADMTRDFTCRVTSRKNSLLGVNKLSEGSTSTSEHHFFLECYVPIAVRPKDGKSSPTPGSAGGSATSPTSFDIYPGVQMMTRGPSGVVEPVEFVSNVVSGHKPSRDSLKQYVDTLERDTDGTKKNTRMNLLHVGFTREYWRVGKVLHELREEGIKTAEKYAKSHNLTVISGNGQAGDEEYTLPAERQESIQQATQYFRIAPNRDYKLVIRSNAADDSGPDAVLSLPPAISLAKDNEGDYWALTNVLANIEVQSSERAAVRAKEYLRSWSNTPAYRGGDGTYPYRVSDIGTAAAMASQWSSAWRTVLSAFCEASELLSDRGLHASLLDSQKEKDGPSFGKYLASLHMDDAESRGYRSYIIWPATSLNLRIPSSVNGHEGAFGLEPGTDVSVWPTLVMDMLPDGTGVHFEFGNEFGSSKGTTDTLWQSFQKTHLPRLSPEFGEWATACKHRLRLGQVEDVLSVLDEYRAVYKTAVTNFANSHGLEIVNPERSMLASSPEGEIGGTSRRFSES